MVWVALCRVVLVLIIAGFVIWCGEKSGVSFLNELLVLFGYPPKSRAALFGGYLPIRYCVTGFACRVPTWKLPVDGSVAGLLADFSGGCHAVLLVS